MMATRIDARGQPIRHQLYFLVLAAVLPLILVFAYDLYQETQDGFRRAQDEAQRLAKVAAADAQGYFARTEQRLGDIARRVEVGSLEPARCKSLFADIAVNMPAWPWLTGTEGWCVLPATTRSHRSKG
mgnify:CR=1 FL=1